MINPDRLRASDVPGLSRGPDTDYLPHLDLGGRDEGSFAILDRVDTPGKTLVRKWPEYGIPDEAVRHFEYFSAQLPQYPSLQRYFAPTVLRINGKGRYFLQEYIKPRDDRTNLSDRSNRALFDKEQIDSPEIMTNLLEIMSDSVRMTSKSLGNQSIGLEPDEVLCPELHLPDGYLIGTRQGDIRDYVYMVDFFPLIPLTPDALRAYLGRIRSDLDEVTHTNFGSSLKDFMSDRSLSDRWLSGKGEESNAAEVVDIEDARAAREAKVATELKILDHIV